MAFKRENFYSEEEAKKEADFLQQKVESGQAKDYSEAGEQLSAIKRELFLKERGRVALNEVLDYELKEGEGRIVIHVWPEEKPGLKKLKEDFLSGLNELAKIIEKDKAINSVEAYSWIIKKHPKLIERFGFKLGEEYTTGEGEAGQGATMARKDFLEKYLESQKQ